MARFKHYTALSSSRHPTGRHPDIPTYRPSSISIGKIERHILVVLSQDPDMRFSTRGFSKKFNYGKTSVFDATQRLKNYGFLKGDVVNDPDGSEREVPGTLKITSLGLSFLRSEGVSDSFRGECRLPRPGSLSVHAVMFIFPVDSAEQFTHVRLEKAFPGQVSSVKLPNFTQYILKGEDYSLTFGPKSIVLQLQEYLDKDGLPVDVADARLIARAAQFPAILKAVGVEVSCMRMAEAHYARVGSWLAASLERIDGRYCMELRDGSKLWIDRSLGPLELESDSAENIKKLDALLRDFIEGDVSWGELVGRVRSADARLERVSLIQERQLRLHLEAHREEIRSLLRLVPQHNQSRIDDFKDDGVPNYVG